MTRRIRVDGALAYVPLTQGIEAVIDAADVPLVEGVIWHARVKPGATSYAVHRVSNGDGTRTDVWMHRLIARTPEGLDTDHIDGNGLNNQRCNLRNATKSQNMHNARPRRDNSSGVKGVSWNKRRSKWTARIRLGGVQHHLGQYATLDDAQAAYTQASARLHGEFARLP